MASKTRATGGMAVSNETVPLPPQTPPPIQGGGDYSPYVWKQLGDIQQAMGRLESSLMQVQRNQEKADEKADKLEERLSGVTHKIYAATVILTILLVVGGFIVNKAWDLMVVAIAEKTAAIAPALPSGSPPVRQ